MDFLDNKLHLALVAVVGFAILGMATPTWAFFHEAETEPAEEPVAPEEEVVPPGSPEAQEIPGEDPLLQPEEDPRVPPFVPEEEEPADPLLDPFTLDEEPVAPEEEPVAPEEEEEPVTAEPIRAPTDRFSSSTTWSPAPNAQATITLEGSGISVQDLNLDHDGMDPNVSTVLIEATLSLQPHDDADAALPQTLDDDADQEQLTPPNDTKPQQSNGVDQEPNIPQRTMDDGFFKAVTFAFGQPWVSITIEGTGMEAQSMSVRQSMTAEDTFSIRVEASFGTDPAMLAPVPEEDPFAVPGPVEDPLGVPPADEEDPFTVPAPEEDPLGVQPEAPTTPEEEAPATADQERIEELQEDLPTAPEEPIPPELQPPTPSEDPFALP